MRGMGRGDGSNGRLADAVVGEPNRPAEKIREPRGDGAEAHLRIRLPLRSSEVARQHDGGSLVERVRDGRNRRADARVVADHAVLQRDVEIDPDEDPLTAEVQILDGELGPQNARFLV